MPSLWHRLLVRLGLRRKPIVWHGANVSLSILGPDGKRAVIAVFKNVTYGPCPDFYELGPGHHQPGPVGPASSDAAHALRRVPMTTEQANLFRERHCSACLTACSCGKARNEPHREDCPHKCTHSYQSFLKFETKESK